MLPLGFKRLTRDSNYRKLRVIQNKRLRVIGDYPRGIPISHLHDILNTEPALHPPNTVKFFANCPTHPKPVVQKIRNYTLDDLNCLYKTDKHKRPKYTLL
jgi:hypothetical protein